jgi:hypothetical protein
MKQIHASFQDFNSKKSIKEEAVMMPYGHLMSYLTTWNTERAEKVTKINSLYSDEK